MHRTKRRNPPRRLAQPIVIQYGNESNNSRSKIIADNEDDLQRQLHTFNFTANKLYMRISVEKTKCIVISKEPRRCKLEIDGKIVEQVMKFNYLGVEVTSDRDIRTQGNHQKRQE
ncbi:unnamed protein product [Diabrotica balteata]|uniref:Uncharacterized protein n=1 Tax=Diabrotica balteata TaxID=107213 RepID=A0A9N9SU85_DIABA|nr:unnamed protein product [Diabrotica balteata]